MMYASICFWLLLALPGYAIVRRWFREELDAGLLGVFAVSTLASLVLLSPVSILCYVLNLPVAAFAGFCALALLAGVMDLSRGGAWRDVGRLVLAAAGVELLIVLGDCIVGTWNGGFLGGDARIHIARIRFLLDHGFSNLDPFIAEPHFFPIYHTNLVHALFTACAKLTGQDAFGAWSAGVGWGKLLIAGGAYYLAWRIFGRAWPAWIAALVCVAARGPIDYCTYPNQLAPYWIMPLMLGFITRPGTEQNDRRLAVKLAAAAFVLGQVHGLYAAFAVIFLVPALAPGVISRISTGSAGVSPAVSLHNYHGLLTGAVMSAAALCAGLPFVLVSRAKSLLTRPPDVLPPDFDRLLMKVTDDWVVRRPETILSQVGHAPGVLLCATGLLLALTSSLRLRTASLCIAAAVVLAIQFIPPLCTAVLNASGEAFVLERMDFVIVLAMFAFSGAAFAAFIDPRLASGWAGRTMRMLLSMAVLFPAAQLRLHESSRTWSNVFEKARLPADQRHGDLFRLRAVREFLAEHVPPGAVVLSDPVTVLEIVQMYDCRVAASPSAGNGVPDMAARFYDMLLMLAEETPWPRRRALLKKHRVEYYFSPGTAVDWVRAHADETWTAGPWFLARLKRE